jgi:predicted ATP-grasp superfamily ATP-dependent carboligase
MGPARTADREVQVDVLDPSELYELDPQLPTLDRPILVHALSGFIDAGNAGRLFREHLLSTLEHRVVATFDVDQLLDYRSRRPMMVFVESRWESYDEPRLLLHVVQDAAGTPFLLLDGAEPDVQWERFLAAVFALVDRFGVRLTVGVHGIPMGVPHTRPAGVTAHATRAALVAGHEPWIDTVQVPASVANLLEYRLGQAGRDAMGFAVHVPHYLAQAEYPQAAAVLVDSVARATGLSLPTRGLRDAAERTREEIDAQVAESAEVGAVVRALEQQYDAFLGSRSRENLLAAGGGFPTAEELGAELERFLAEQAKGGEGENG